MRLPCPGDGSFRLYRIGEALFRKAPAFRLFPGKFEFFLQIEGGPGPAEKDRGLGEVHIVVTSDADGVLIEAAPDRGDNIRYIADIFRRFFPFDITRTDSIKWLRRSGADFLKTPVKIGGQAPIQIYLVNLGGTFIDIFNIKYGRFRAVFFKARKRPLPTGTRGTPPHGPRPDRPRQETPHCLSGDGWAGAAEKDRRSGFQPNEKQELNRADKKRRRLRLKMYGLTIFLRPFKRRPYIRR